MMGKDRMRYEKKRSTRLWLPLGEHLAQVPREAFSHLKSLDVVYRAHPYGYQFKFPIGDILNFWPRRGKMAWQGPNENLPLSFDLGRTVDAYLLFLVTSLDL
jgi:hypothetical protein